MTDTSAPPAHFAAALARYAELPDPAPLLALNFGFARARALGTALDLGVFTALAEAPRTTAELAGDLGCDARVLGELLAVLEDFGLVAGGGGPGAGGARDGVAGGGGSGAGGPGDGVAGGVEPGAGGLSDGVAGGVGPSAGGPGDNGSRGLRPGGGAVGDAGLGGLGPDDGGPGDGVAGGVGPSAGGPGDNGSRGLRPGGGAVGDAGPGGLGPDDGVAVDGRSGGGTARDLGPDDGVTGGAGADDGRAPDGGAPDGRVPDGGARWAPTDLALAYLVEGAPAHLGDHFDEVLAQWDRWSALTSLVRSGDRSRHLGDRGSDVGDRGGDPGDPTLRGHHRGMFAGAFPLAVRIATGVVEALDLRDAGQVLDLTCGSGEWGIALAGADPRARVTAHDDPALLAVARGRAAEFGVAERFRFVPGGYEEIPFAEGEFDTVVMAHAGRFAGPRTAGRLIRECARVLRPGGTLLLADIMRTPPGQPPLSRPMLALSLMVNTENGGLPEAGEYRALMAEAGIAAKECVTRGLVTALTGERQ